MSDSKQSTIQQAYETFKVSLQGKVEPFCNSSHRYRQFPIEHEDLWELYNKHCDKFWKAEEVDLSKDYESFKNDCKPHEQRAIRILHGLFASADNVVMHNLGDVLLKCLVSPEAQAFLWDQGSREVIHAKTYNNIIDVITHNDTKAKEELFGAIDNLDLVKDLLTWITEWIKEDVPVQWALPLWCGIEGVLFQPMFAAIFSFRATGRLPGMTFANEKISEDEGLHVKFGAKVFRDKLIHKPPVEMIHLMYRSLVSVVQKFIRGMITQPLDQVSANDLCQFTEYVADGVLDLLGVPMLFKVKNPLPFMKTLNIPGKSNFFEKRTGEYVVGGQEQEIDKIILDDVDDDF